MRHNKIRDLTSVALAEVCPDVRRKPRIIKLDGEQLALRTANKSSEARLDFSTTGFWTPGQRIFFDLLRSKVQGFESRKMFSTKRNGKEKALK